MQKKEEAKKPDFIKWFSELNKDSGNVAGGKGANLAEIYNLKIDVPPGFIVTAQAYDYFIEKAGIKEKIQELLAKIDYEDTAQLDKITRNVRAFIIDSSFPKEMEVEILEAYEHMGASEDDYTNKSVSDLLKVASEPIFVAVRSSATAEDLAGASFAGQQDTYLNVKGKDDLLKNVRKCFASLFTSRATYYRNKKGFKHDQVSLAVVVQKMVDSDKSGVIFSKDPAYKNENVVMEAVWGLGEGIVSGKVTPDRYIISQDLQILEKKIADKKIALTRDSSGGKAIVTLREEKSKHQVLKDHEMQKLAEIALKLEDHYKAPQDIEFAIEKEEIYIVQTRPITTMETRHEEGGRKELKGEVILEGLAASPGIGVGKLRIIDDLKDLDKIQKGDVLVTKMTNPDMVVTMQKCSAIVTDDGGMTAHASIVSREMGIPAVVGTKEGTTRLKDGEIITVDGFTGKIYKGKVAETQQKEIKEVSAKTKTQIKVIVDLPTFAERAAKTGIKKVGLTRVEGIIAESGKHPNYFLKQDKMKDYEEVIFKGINEIAEHFEEIWVRTSDLRSDEFGNLEGSPGYEEANPMLGFHGIRYSLKNPEILKSELKALKRVSDKNKTVGLLLPQIILVEEVQKVKEYLEEVNFKDAKVGVMVETPAAVQIIGDLCKEGIDFISFGTNDLTQYMLAVDRGNEKVQHLFNELHPAVLRQLEFVIRVCKRNNVETSICGQAGSKKEMVKFLVEKGIDSISVNADVAKEISDYVAELEGAVEAPTENKEESSTPNGVSQDISATLKGITKGHQTSEMPTGDKEVVEKNREPHHKSFLEKAEEVVENFIEDVGGEFLPPNISEKEDADTEEEIPQIRGVESLSKEEVVEEISETPKEEIMDPEEIISERESEDVEPEFNADNIQEHENHSEKNITSKGVPRDISSEISTSDKEDEVLDIF